MCLQAASRAGPPSLLGQCARGLERPLLCAIGTNHRPLQRRQHPATTRRRARGYRDRPPGSTQPRPCSPRSRLPSLQAALLPRQYGLLLKTRSTHLELQGPQSPRRDLGVRFRPTRVPCLNGEITALVMPTNGVTNGPCNTSNPSNITACLGHTAALTLSCVSPGQDAGVAPPGRRLPAPLPPRQGNRPSFYPVLPTPREARIGETQIPFGGSRSHCAAAQPAAGRHQLNTPRAAAAA